eukprot:s11094_g1.t1
MEVDKDTGGVRHNKAENYLPKIPMLSHDKMGTRASEIANWAEFTESISSWLALLDDFYPVELYRATITFLGTAQPQQQPASVTEQQLASQVVQAQSQQISELVQLVKNLGEMQAASLARGAVSASAGASGAATGAETVGDPMEVDKDTGGVRHNKAENYLPKIPMLSHEKMGTRASEIANWAEFTESISSWLALLDDFYPVE